MARIAPALSAKAVEQKREPGLYAVGGQPGLCLQVGPTGARSWILRVMVGGKRRDMGLGGYPSVSLKAARDAAAEARAKIRAGEDPIEDRRERKSALLAAAARGRTFEEAVVDYLEKHEAGWRNAKHRGQWESTLKTYAYPVIGPLDPKHIETAHILKVLEPIWTKIPETAMRVRGRIEQVLAREAARRGALDYANPARLKAHLDVLLGPARRKEDKGHHAAIPFVQVGDFMARLREAKGQGARALEFTILTAARSGETRGARWSEIDLANKLWVVPASRMKAGKEHRVPLSDAAVALLEAQPKGKETDLIFPSAKGGELSDMTLTAVLRRMKVAVTAHGFRSTFRDWAAETTGYPRDVAEMALAHTIGDKVEAAYRRGDLLAKRRRMMQEWATYCAMASPKGEVVAIRGR